MPGGKVDNPEKIQPFRVVSIRPVLWKSWGILGIIRGFPLFSHTFKKKSRFTWNQEVSREQSYKGLR